MFALHTQPIVLKSVEILGYTAYIMSLLKFRQTQQEVNIYKYIGQKLIVVCGTKLGIN